MKNLAAFYDHILDVGKQEGISVSEALEEAARLGISYMEVSYANAKDGPESLARELARCGLGVSAMPAFFEFGRDQNVEAQALPVLDAAEALGAERLLVIPGFTHGGPDERAAQTESMLDCVARLGELAERRGLPLVMEEFDNGDSPIATVQGLRQFLDRCPGLLACFDTGNFRFAAQDEVEAYQALRRSVGHVHLKDRMLTGQFGPWPLTALDGAVLYPSPVGAGVIQIEKILGMLQEDGYEGLFTLEHYGAEPMLDCLRRSAAWIQSKM